MAGADWDWLKLWTFWNARLELPPDLFWEVTPREYFALVDEYHEAERAENVRAGTVAAMCMNAQRSSKDQKVWTWDDFFGDPQPEASRKKTRHETLVMLQRFKAAAGQRKIRR